MLHSLPTIHPQALTESAQRRALWQAKAAAEAGSEQRILTFLTRVERLDVWLEGADPFALIDQSLEALSAPPIALKTPLTKDSESTILARRHIDAWPADTIAHWLEMAMRSRLVSATTIHQALDDDRAPGLLASILSEALNTPRLSFCLDESGAVCIEPHPSVWALGVDSLDGAGCALINAALNELSQIFPFLPPAALLGPDGWGWWLFDEGWCSEDDELARRLPQLREDWSATWIETSGRGPRWSTALQSEFIGRPLERWLLRVEAARQTWRGRYCPETCETEDSYYDEAVDFREVLLVLPAGWAVDLVVPSFEENLGNSGLCPLRADTPRALVDLTGRYRIVRTLLDELFMILEEPD